MAARQQAVAAQKRRPRGAPTLRAKPVPSRGAYALRFGPDEPLPYEPASFIWDESRCALSGDLMTLDTVEGREGGVAFALYPAQAPDSRVEVTAELRVERAAENGCALSAGCWVHSTPT
jgi:hypothetical protein